MALKRMMLLTGMALAAIAFAVPATASALPKTDGTHWTNGDEHPVVNDEVEIKAPFEGFIDFTAPMPPFPIHSTFGCEVTMTVAVKGPTVADVTEYRPTNGTCLGTGIFAGCLLKADMNNAPWNVINKKGNTSAVPPTASDFEISRNSGDITVKYEFEKCSAGAVPSIDLTFISLTLTPTLDENGTVTGLAISGKDTSGFVTTGPPMGTEPGEKIGVKTIEVID